MAPPPRAPIYAGRRHLSNYPTKPSEPLLPVRDPRRTPFGVRCRSPHRGWSRRRPRTKRVSAANRGAAAPGGGAWHRLV